MKRRAMTQEENQELKSLEADMSVCFHRANDLASDYEAHKVDEDLIQKVQDVAEELNDALNTIGALIRDSEAGEYNYVNHSEYNVVYYYEVPVLVRFSIEGDPDEEPNSAMKEQQLNEAFDAGNVEVNWQYERKTIRGDVEG